MALQAAQQLPVVNWLKLSYSLPKSFRDGIKYTNSLELSRLFQRIWDKDTIFLKESSYILYLSKRNLAIGCYLLSEGDKDSTFMDIRLILSTALLCNAHSIVIAHNHPTGLCTPSEADQRMTTKIKLAAAALDIKVTDSIIISEDDYYSMADEGVL